MGSTLRGETEGTPELSAPPGASNPIARVLVVDDEPFVRDFLCRVLSDLGVTVQVATDGREAERWLKATTFDLLFLDLDLPHISGELLLELMRKRILLRPESVVVMSGGAELAATAVRDWADLGVANLLPKPFTAGDVRAIVRRALTAAGRMKDDAPTRVLVAGAGLWSEALARVLETSGGKLVEVQSRPDVMREARRLKPPVIVIGSGLMGEALKDACEEIHADPALSTCAMVVALQDTSPFKPGELLDAGATRVLLIPTELGELSTTVTRLAGLSRRIYRRAPLTTAVRLAGTGEVLVGSATDLSEGGLGVKGIATRPFLEAMQVEFALPGEEAPLIAVSEIVWTRPEDDKTHRAGVRFTRIDDQQLARVRAYVSTHA
jgi:DNA-binding response OmpR family regulator